MLGLFKTRPKLTVLAAVLLAAAAFFGIRGALVIGSVERLERHPRLLQELEQAGREHIRQSLGLELPDTEPEPVEASRRGDVRLSWDSRRGFFDSFFMPAQFFISPLPAPF